MRYNCAKFSHLTQKIIFLDNFSIGILFYLLCHIMQQGLQKLLQQILRYRLVYHWKKTGQVFPFFPNPFYLFIYLFIFWIFTPVIFIYSLCLIVLSLKKIFKRDAAIYVLLILFHNWAQISHLGSKILLHGFYWLISKVWWQ